MIYSQSDGNESLCLAGAAEHLYYSVDIQSVWDANPEDA
jgi:hypothetical protein